MNAPKHVLILVEDPGACNYVKEFQSAFAEVGVHADLVVSGPGVAYLTARHITFQTVQPETSASELLSTYDPSLVILGTSENKRSIALAVTHECRKLGIPTVAVVDMAVNAHLRFRGTADWPLAYAPDWLLVPDNLCKSEYEKLGFSGSAIVVVGHPHYDHVRSMTGLSAKKCQQLRKKLVGGDLDRRILTFVAEGKDLLNPSASTRSEQYTLSGRGRSQFRTAIVLEELLDALAQLHAKPYVVVRLHPKMAQDDLAEFAKEIDFFSIEEDPLEVIGASDLVIGMSSMMLQEAVIMGKQTLSILPRKEEQRWLSTTSDGSTPCVFSSSELRLFLDEFFTNPWSSEALGGFVYQSGALRAVIDFVCGVLNGASTAQFQ